FPHRGGSRGLSNAALRLIGRARPMDSGLAGLVAAETVLSHSDGARGILWVRGHTLAELAADFGYDGAVGLLWEGFDGPRLGRDIMRSSLGRARERASGGKVSRMTSDVAANRPKSWRPSAVCRLR